MARISAGTSAKTAAVAATAAVLCGGPSVAQAGSGPWVVGAGASSWFGSVEAQRLTQLSIVTDDSGATDVIDVGEGLSTLGVKGIVTYGILPRAEVELEVPWSRVYANRPDAALCGALGLGACRTTQGVGILRAQVKALVLDELRGAPLSASLALTSRYGAFTAPDRERITNLGEGTFDLGPTLSLGRTGGIPGGGFWSAYLDAGWRYRFANTDAFPDTDLPVPGSETHGTLGALLSPGEGLIGVGPLCTTLWRPEGLDWYELAAAPGGLSDIDRFSALKVSNVRLGGELLLRGREGMALSLSALRTVAARNNPEDAFVFTVGLSTYRSPGS